MPRISRRCRYEDFKADSSFPGAHSRFFSHKEMNLLKESEFAEEDEKEGKDNGKDFIYGGNPFKSGDDHCCCPGTEYFSNSSHSTGEGQSTNLELMLAKEVGINRSITSLIAYLGSLENK